MTRCDFFISLITQSRGRAEGVAPALAQTKGKRFACFRKPEGTESINVGLMKELSGGDIPMARGLHKDPTEFKPQFKMVLTCNVLPNINAMTEELGAVFVLLNSSRFSQT